MVLIVYLKLYGSYHMGHMIWAISTDHMAYIKAQRPKGPKAQRPISYGLYQGTKVHRSVSESIIFNEQLKSFSLFCNSEDSFDFNFH